MDVSSHGKVEALEPTHDEAGRSIQGLLILLHEHGFEWDEDINAWYREMPDGGRIMFNYVGIEHAKPRLLLKAIQDMYEQEKHMENEIERFERLLEQEKLNQRHEAIRDFFESLFIFAIGAVIIAFPLSLLWNVIVGGVLGGPLISYIESMGLLWLLRLIGWGLRGGSFE